MEIKKKVSVAKLNLFLFTLIFLKHLTRKTSEILLLSKTNLNLWHCMDNFDFSSAVIYICKSKATPAKVHFAGLSFDFKLKVHTYVGPRVLVL